MLNALRGRGEVYFSIRLIEDFPAASAFLQYVVHALAVSGLDAVRGDMEGLLRSSFVFQQARAESSELAEDLVRLARLYVDDLAGRKRQALRGFARMSDGTGFSSPSIDLMWAEWRVHDQVAAEDWSSTNLFPTDNTASPLLTRVVDTLHRVPEVRLGSEEEGVFSAERIARITTSWVNGATLAEIAGAEYGGDILRCTQHIYGAIVNLVPWGLRAVARVALATDADPDAVATDRDLLPAMVFHGVRTKEAVALRMQQVPRFVAEALGQRLREAAPGMDVGDWLLTTSPADWDAALPDQATISGRECQQIWRVLEGATTWMDLTNPA